MAAEGSGGSPSVSVLVRSTYLKLLQQTALTVRTITLTHAHAHTRLQYCQR